jgi:hypothetical protein
MLLGLKTGLLSAQSMPFMLSYLVKSRAYLGPTRDPAAPLFQVALMHSHGLAREAAI